MAEEVEQQGFRELVRAALEAAGVELDKPKQRELERALAQDSGTRHAVACSSGTDALLLALSCGLATSRK